MSKIRNIIETLNINEENFKKWFTTFIEEKGFDLDDDVPNLKEDDFYGEVMGLTIEAVIEFCSQLPTSQQKSIKDTLVKIDFKNGNVMDFITHLANGMISFGSR